MASSPSFTADHRRHPFAALFARRETGVSLVLAATVLAVSIINSAFVSAENLRDILIKVSPFAIIGSGITFVILTGEIDISVGSLMGFLAAILGSLVSAEHAHLPVALAILITLLVGTAVGFLNGVLVTFGRVPSIIVTLGTLTVLRGCTELIMHGEWVKDLPAGLRFFGIGTIAGVPVSVLTAIIVVALCAIAARLTPIGRRIYAVGSNAHAAVLAGLSPNRIKLFVFTLTGVLTAVATIVSVPQLSVIDSGIGIGLELFVVTAVVVGGTSISGGKGTIAGTVLGVILLGIVRSALLFLKLGTSATYWERAIQGGFILVAVLVDHLSSDRAGEEA